MQNEVYEKVSDATFRRLPQHFKPVSSPQKCVNNGRKFRAKTTARKNCNFPLISNNNFVEI